MFLHVLRLFVSWSLQELECLLPGEHVCFSWSFRAFAGMFFPGRPNVAPVWSCWAKVLWRTPEFQTMYSFVRAATALDPFLGQARGRVSSHKPGTVPKSLVARLGAKGWRNPAILFNPAKTHILGVLGFHGRNSGRWSSMAIFAALRLTGTVGFRNKLSSSPCGLPPKQQEKHGFDGVDLHHFFPFVSWEFFLI